MLLAKITIKHEHSSSVMGVAALYDIYTNQNNKESKIKANLTS
jgi:hypothetical protein